MRKATRWQDRVVAQPDTGCWLWQGRVDTRGRPQFTRDGKTLYAHRVAWAEANGQSVPEGMLVMQTCGASVCCNPSHLFLMTVEDLRKSEATPWHERLTKDQNGCWLWTGAFHTDGYGQIRLNGKTLRVHRLAWEEVNGPIPEGMAVCHTCDIPGCCNPAHLFLGTQRENIADMRAKGRFRWGPWVNAKKTHCPFGHEYTPENTMTFNGMRSCRQCMNERSAAHHRRKRFNQ
jgi:hypothetical protein